MRFSYARSAVDGDGDGTIDLCDSPADSIFGVAHYFSGKGAYTHDDFGYGKAVLRYKNDMTSVRDHAGYTQALCNS